MFFGIFMLDSCFIYVRLAKIQHFIEQNTTLYTTYLNFQMDNILNNASERLTQSYAHLKKSRLVKNKSDFAEKLGYNRSYITELLNGGKPITELFAGRLEEKFNIDREWLITGDGNMLAPVIRIHGNSDSVYEVDQRYLEAITETVRQAVLNTIYLIKPSSESIDEEKLASKVGDDVAKFHHKVLSDPKLNNLQAATEGIKSVVEEAVRSVLKKTNDD